MGTDDEKRRRMEDRAERGRAERDYRRDQQSRNARSANSAERTRDAAREYAALREKEKAMAKAKRVADMQKKKQAVKNFATKPMSERVSDSLFKAIDKTQLEEQYGIVDEKESGFKRSFRRNFAKSASKRIYKGNKLKTDLANGDRPRSDGKVVVNREYVAACRQLPANEKKQEVAGLAAMIKERMANLQALIIEKGLYTGPSTSAEVTLGI